MPSIACQTDFEYEIIETPDYYIPVNKMCEYYTYNPTIRTIIFSLYSNNKKPDTDMNKTTMTEYSKLNEDILQGMIDDMDSMANAFEASL
jgi:hypothetical protein